MTRIYHRQHVNSKSNAHHCYFTCIVLLYHQYHVEIGCGLSTIIKAIFDLIDLTNFRGAPSMEFRWVQVQVPDSYYLAGYKYEYR